MSYILDALRKAEAERARGAVPGVHAQQGPEDRADGGSRQAVKLLAGAVVALLVALLAVLGWQWMDRRPELASASPPAVSEGRSAARDDVIAQAPSAVTAPAPSREAMPAAPPVTAAMPAPAPSAKTERSGAGSRTQEPLPRDLPPEGLEQPRALPVRPAVPASAMPHTPPTAVTSNGDTHANGRSPRDATSAGSTTPTASANTRNPGAPATPALDARTAGQPSATTSPQPQLQSQAQSQSQSQVRTPAIAPSTNSQAAQLQQQPQQQPQQPPQQQQQQRVYAMNELPDSIRSSLPSYAVSGSSYSENAAARLLILNGQVAREGDMLPGGAILEQIKLKSAVLRFKGYRFEMNLLTCVNRVRLGRPDNARLSNSALVRA